MNLKPFNWRCVVAALALMLAGQSALGLSLTAFYDFEGTDLDRFDDPAGAFADDLVGQLNPMFSADVPGINGGTQSAEFAGNTALYTDAFTPDLAPDANEFSLSFWIKGTDSLQENNNIRLITSRVRPDNSQTNDERSWQVEGFGQGNGNGMDVRYQPGTSSPYPQNWFSPDAIDALSQDLNEPEEWKHVVFLLANSGHPGDGGAFGRTFVDGVQVGGIYNPPTDWDGNTLANMTGQLLIGGHSETGGTRFFTGLLDDVALWSGLLSDDDILAMAEGRLSPSDFLNTGSSGVPEPATGALALLGLVALARRRRQTHAYLS